MGVRLCDSIPHIWLSDPINLSHPSTNIIVYLKQTHALANAKPAPCQKSEACDQR